MTKRDTPAKAAGKKAPAKKAPAKKAPADDNGDKATRRNFGKNWLAEAIDKALRTETYDVPLTVTMLRAMISNSVGEQPSTGAISACIVRWGEQGYIRVNEKPLGFKAFTAKYKDKTLADFLEDQREKRKKERAAAKAA